MSCASIHTWIAWSVPRRGQTVPHHEFQRPVGLCLAARRRASRWRRCTGSTRSATTGPATGADPRPRTVSGATPRCCPVWGVDDAYAADVGRPVFVRQAALSDELDLDVQLMNEGGHPRAASRTAAWRWDRLRRRLRRPPLLPAHPGKRRRGRLPLLQPAGASGASSTCPRRGAGPSITGNANSSAARCASTAPTSPPPAGKCATTCATSSRRARWWTSPRFSNRAGSRKKTMGLDIAAHFGPAPCPTLSLPHRRRHRAGGDRRRSGS